MLWQKLSSASQSSQIEAVFRSVTLGTSGSIAWPTGAVAGDFAFYYWAGSSTSIFESNVNPGAGWTLLHAQVNLSRRSWLYGKILTTSDFSSQISAPSATAVNTQLHAYQLPNGGSGFTKLESSGQNGSGPMQANLTAQDCSIAAGFRNIITGSTLANLTVTPNTNWTVATANSQNQYAYNTSGSIPQTLLETGVGGTGATWLSAVSIQITA